MNSSGHTGRGEDIDPRRPHKYRLETDAGMGALASGGGSVGPQVASIGIASRSTRTIGCGVPGCGKPAEDEIHAPAEE
jgi:hypothetical protein